MRSAKNVKVRVTVSLDKETLNLLDAWREPLAFTGSRTRGVAALIGIALGDARWGDNTPGFGAAWTPVPGYESVARKRPGSGSASVNHKASLSHRKTSTGHVLRLIS